MDDRDRDRIVFEHRRKMALKPNWRLAMRQDAHLWVRPDAQSFMPPGVPHPALTFLTEQKSYDVYGAPRGTAATSSGGLTPEDWKEIAALRFELALIKHELLRRKALHPSHYNPDQPRVPAGVPEGGEWTREGTLGTVVRVADAGNRPQPDFDSRQPIYDKADAALMPPKGANPSGSEKKLRYNLDDDSHYLAGATIINEDRTLVGRYIQSTLGTPVSIRFTAEIDAANGTSTRIFEVTRNLPPGASVTVPWKELGLIQGPGRVEVLVTNVGSLYTGVVVGASRVPGR